MRISPNRVLIILGHIGCVRIVPNRILILGNGADAGIRPHRMMGTAAFARMRPHGTLGTAANGGMHLSQNKGDGITANFRK